MAKWGILGWSGFDPETRPKWSGGPSDMFRHVGNAFLLHFLKIEFWQKKWDFWSKTGFLEGRGGGFMVGEGARFRPGFGR